jgi:hypothetical protein
MGCTDIKTGEVWQFQLVKNCLKSLVRLKYVATGCDFNSILK